MGNEFQPAEATCAKVLRHAGTWPKQRVESGLCEQGTVRESAIRITLARQAAHMAWDPEGHVEEPKFILKGVEKRKKRERREELYRAAGGGEIQ